MISIVYAYPLEVKVLKELASENDLQAEICWHRWPSLSSKTEGLIFNVGFAGCLNPGLALGQVVLVNRIMAEGEEPVLLEGFNQTLAEKYCKRYNLPLATLLTVENPLTSVTKRDELRQSTGADVVDMEGHRLYSLAKKKNIAVVSMKVISDNADSDTMQTIRQNSGRWSENLGKTAFKFLKSYENLGYYSNL